MADALLDAAQRVIAEHGLQHATLERIARAVGVSRVTLHRRGLSREDIVGALADRALDRYQDALWPAQSLTQPGLAAAVGILLYTFVVRALVVPSLAVLLGRWNWWPSARSAVE